MGLSRRLIYLDTSIVIYFVEQHPSFGAKINSVLGRESGSEFCVSPLVEMEVLVGPLKTGNNPLNDRYRGFFTHVTMLDMPRTVFSKAAEFRIRYGLKTPEALHLSTAQYHGCASLWSDNERLTQAVGDFAVNICQDA